MLSPALIHKISEEIYRRFPEVAGAAPTVRVQKVPGAPREAPTNYLLSFKGSGRTADQRKIDTFIRVMVDGKGKILKISSSR